MTDEKSMKPNITKTTSPKFVHITAVPPTDNSNLVVYALDEAGDVWLHVADYGNWLRLPSKRYEREEP